MRYSCSAVVHQLGVHSTTGYAFNNWVYIRQFHIHENSPQSVTLSRQMYQFVRHLLKIIAFIISRALSTVIGPGFCFNSSLIVKKPSFELNPSKMSTFANCPLLNRVKGWSVRSVPSITGLNKRCGPLLTMSDRGIVRNCCTASLTFCALLRPGRI